MEPTTSIVISVEETLGSDLLKVVNTREISDIVAKNVELHLYSFQPISLSCKLLTV